VKEGDKMKIKELPKIKTGQRRIDIIVMKEFTRIYKKSLDYFLK